MNLLPTLCSLRVAKWSPCGGQNNNWNYKLFIQHLNDNFEDKTSVRQACFALAIMKEAKNQSFSEFLLAFEYTLAQVKGLNQEGRIKVNNLYMSLNEKLTMVLYPIDLLEENYTCFISQVRRSRSY